MSDKDKSKIVRSVLSTLPTGPIDNFYYLLTDKQKQELKRTGFGITSQIVREGIELSRMVTKPTEEEIDSTEQFLENLYSGVVGAENVERVQRGEREVVEIKEPESTPLQVTRDIGSFAASLAGVGKLTKPLSFLKPVQKATQVAPKTTKTIGFVAKGEAATQLAINPYQENLANILGGMIEDGNEGLLGDIEKYILEPLKSSQEKTELENRLGLLAEGLVLTGAVGAGIAGVSKLPEIKKSLVENFNKIRQGTKEEKEAFLNVIKRYRRQDKDAYDVSLKARQKDLQEAQNTLFPDRSYSLGDIEALREGKLFLNKFSTIPVLRSISNALAKTFTTRGGRSKLLHENYLKTQAINDKWELTIDHVGRNLEKAIDDIVRISGKDKTIVAKDLDKALFSDFRVPTVITPKKFGAGKSQDEGFKKALEKFPKEARPAIIKARNLQDTLSRLLLQSESVSKADKEIIKDQLGFYVRQSFKLFEDPSYVPSSKVHYDARRFIKRDIEKRNPNITPSELRLQTQSEMELLAGGKSKYNNFSSGYDSFRAVQDKILQKRVDIPDEIKAYLGEINDPVQKLVISMNKINKFVTDMNFHNQAYRDGKDIYFFDSKTARPGFNKKIPSIPDAKVQPFGDLSGKYTTPNLHYYYTNKYQKGVLYDGENLLGEIYRGLIYWKSQSQKSKTVRRINTHIKNIFGGIQISGANGLQVFSKDGLTQSSKAIWSQLSKTTDREKQQYVEKLAGYGLLNKGPIARELNNLIKEGVNVKTPVGQKFISWVKSLKDKQPTKGLLGIDDKLQETYIAEDDFFKINMFETEIKNLKSFNDALPKDRKFDYVRFNSQEAIEQQAADLTRNALPNYDLVPDNIKKLRGIPFIGRFFSFLTESTRLAITIPIQAGKEITLGNKLIKEGASEAGKILRKRGLDRAVGYSIFGIGGSYAATNTANYLMGLTKDKIEDLKVFIPEYAQNDSVAFTVNEDGVPVYNNFSPWDSFDFPRKPFQTFIHLMSEKDTMSEEEQNDYILQTLNETLTPFFGESITQEALSSYFLRGGRDSQNRLIRNPYDRTQVFNDSGNTLQNWLNEDNRKILFFNLVEAVEPGTITDIRNYSKTYGKEETELDQTIYPRQQMVKLLTGFGGTPLNKEYLERVYSFKINDFTNAKSKKSSRLYNAITDDATKEVFIDNYLKQNEEYYKDYAKFHRATEAAENLNLSTFKLLNDGGVAKIDQSTFLSNTRYFNPLKITDTMQQRMLQTNGDLYNNYYDVMLEIDEISKILRQLPVLIEENKIEEKLPSKDTREQLFKDLRLSKATGGLIEGKDDVPYTKENPADRVDPFTGQPYSAQMEELGLDVFQER